MSVSLQAEGWYVILVTFVGVGVLRKFSICWLFVLLYEQDCENKSILDCTHIFRFDSVTSKT